MHLVNLLVALGLISIGQAAYSQSSQPYDEASSPILSSPQVAYSKGNAPRPASRTRTPLSTESFRASAISPGLSKVQLGAATAALIGHLNIRPSLLTRPTDEAIDFSKSVSGIGLPKQFAHLQLSIGTEAFELFYADETADPVYEAQHVLMSVLNQTNSYARFTVDQRTREVVGTLHTPETTYLFLPDPESGGQNVYQLSGEISWAPDSPMLRSSRTRNLVRRHLVLDRLAQLQPREAAISANAGFAMIRGGDLGRISAIDAPQILETLNRLSLFTQVTGRETITEPVIVDYGDRSRRAYFKQLINGIEVAWDENYVHVDANGAVRELNIGLADPAKITGPITVNKEEAVRLAGRALESYYNARLEVELVGEIEIKYWFTDEGYVVPKYLLAVSAKGPSGVESAFVMINAVSGAAEVISAVHAHNGAEICMDTSGRIRPPATPPIACGMKYSPIYYSIAPAAAAQCPPDYTGGAPCSSTKLQVPTKVVKDMLGTLQSNTAAEAPEFRCCNYSKLNVLVDARVEPAPAWDSIQRVIRLPPTRNESAEAIAHEVGHAHTYFTNYTLLLNKEHIAKTIQEGLADVIAVTYGAVGNPATSTGETWIYGDGYQPLPLSLRRNIAEEKQFSWIASNPSDYHKASLAISNFFYRVRDASGASLARILRLALKTTDVIAPNSQGQYGLTEFKKAVRTAANGETVILDAIETVWSQMYDVSGQPLPPNVPPPGVPGQPGPPGSPDAPFNVGGNFVGCGNYGSLYGGFFDLYWSPSSGATDYTVYSKALSEPWYEFDLITSATYAVGWTNDVSAEWRVGACNGFGCSNMSVDSYAPSNPCH